MPRLGFGVYQSVAANDSVTAALHSGYRHIDSARVYRNESEVCRAVSDAGLAGQVFLTSKVRGSARPRCRANRADLSAP